MDILAQTQYSVGGFQGSIYVDIIPDTLLNPISFHNGGQDEEDYYIDVNQDGIMDLKIAAHFSLGLTQM